MRAYYTETGRVGKRGVVTLPAALRKRFGLEDGSLIITEERDDGILLRPAVATPIEIYTDERIAEFLLTNSIDLPDYEEARREVTAMGLDPDRISHVKPTP